MLNDPEELEGASGLTALQASAAEIELKELSDCESLVSMD